MHPQILTQHDLERAVSNIEATLGNVQKDWEQRVSAVSVTEGGRVGRREEGEGRRERGGRRWRISSASACCLYCKCVPMQ